MNKNDFNRKLAQKADIPVASAKKITDVFLQICIDAIEKDERISFLGFGNFSPLHQSERLARNPKTGEPIMIKPRKSVKFRPGKFLLLKINGLK